MQQQCLALCEAAEVVCKPGCPFLVVLSHFIAFLVGAFLSRFWRTDCERPDERPHELPHDLPGLIKVEMPDERPGPIKVELSSQTQFVVVVSEKSVQGPVTYTALRNVRNPRYKFLADHAFGAWP